MPGVQQTVQTSLTSTAAAGLDADLLRAKDVLECSFGVKFSLVDGESGDLLLESPEQPARDWLARSELCRQVARAGQAELIEEDSPLVTLALPIARSRGSGHVAVATFVTRAIGSDGDCRAAARLLGLAPAEAAAWLSRQPVWPVKALQRVAELVTGHLAGAKRVGELEREAESLAVNLSSTYEEISLLHRLTQNLKISESDEDLARLALEWMQAVLPAQGLAVQFVPAADASKPLDHPTGAPLEWLTCGNCPVDNAQMTRLIEHLGIGGNARPLVVNAAVTQSLDWPYPAVRQLIVAPLAEGRNVFGWLAAFNHVRGEEFGTVEASLLNSVSVILGIHSGNIELYRQQSELLTGIVRALTSAIDAKDPYTCGHSDRVAQVAVRLAKEMGCDPKSLKTIYLAGLLHDIGKIGINDSVLRKPGKLTDTEYEHIKTHVEIGHRILVDLKKLDDVLPVVLHHHESWDGKGYPQRLPAQQIPLAARIVAVADSFDAMGSDRPYRKGLPDEKIDQIFREGAGKQWDPEVVAAFFRARDDIRDVCRRSADKIEIQPGLWQ